MRSVLLLVGLLALGQGLARADDVVVVPIVQQGLLSAELSRLRKDVSRELIRQRVNVLSPTSTADRLTARHSRDLVSASAFELEAFHRAALAAHQGLDQAADLRMVLSNMAEVQESVASSPEIFNGPAFRHDTHSACLGAVRALVGHGQQATAREIAEWCLHMLDVDLYDGFAPPMLMPLFRAANQNLSVAQAELSVRVAPQTCTVYLNGVERSSLKRATVARPYSVYATCPDGARSRVHVIVPSAESRTHVIDVAFDAALHTDHHDVILRASPQDSVRYLKMIATATSALYALGIEAVGEQYTLTMVGNGAASKASVPLPYTPASLAGALNELKQGSKQVTPK